MVEGLLHSSPHTAPLSVAAIQEASALADRILPVELADPDSIRHWLNAPWLAGSWRAGWPALPAGFSEFRARIDEGRAQFLAQLRGFMARVMPHYRRLGDLAFSVPWQQAAGRQPGENLDAAFIFQTWLLDRTMRIRYNPEKHPSDYLDYLQLRLLRDQTLAFVTADRKLVRAVSRSLESDRIYPWEELRDSGIEGLGDPGIERLRDSAVFCNP